MTRIICFCLIFIAAVVFDRPASAQANMDRGEKLFLRCVGCHTVSTARASKAGPDLNKLFSRTVGSLAGYPYSRALKDAGFQWTEARLDAWLQDPNGYLPGNKMAFAGLSRPEDRRDLIAYVKYATAQN